MLTNMRGECDYCEKPIPVQMEVCSTCIHNMRELQKDAKLQQLKLNEHVMRNVVEFKMRY